MNQLVLELKEHGQDFEFYPTTKEIIAALVRDMKTRDLLSISRGHYHNKAEASLLDIGAGDGRVIEAIREEIKRHNTAAVNEFGNRMERDTIPIDKFYAMEKSPILCNRLAPWICIIGTDFHEQSLICKTAGVTFCNPPYSEFEAWTEKIIRETASNFVYLVIPERWKDSERIAQALKFRNVSARSLGNFDFEDGDRAARARVQLLMIDFSDCKDDAFETEFKAAFAEYIAAFESTGDGRKIPEAPATGGGKFAQLVIGDGYPSALVGIYNADMENVRRNYAAAAQLDPDLLREFEVHPARIMECLRKRLTELRTVYWNELFSHLEPITSRLTHKSRSALLEMLRANVNVDFTVSNICAVLVWTVKNANAFLDSQLIATFETMAEKCNVENYVSNKRAWVDGWRYEETKNSHFKLDYRIVTARVGGIVTESWRGRNGLEESALFFIGDLLTVADNLGFKACDRWQLHRHEWKANEALEFHYSQPGEAPRPLLHVRAFKNRNLHLKLSPDFILALNVEHGRLKGWIKNAADAAVELQEPKAATVYGRNFQLAGGQVSNLLCA